MMDLESTLLKLEEISAVKFGSFTLKSGIQSPVYFDLRVVVSYPQVMKAVADWLWKTRDPSSKTDLLCGVPYTALPLATLIASQENVPMLIRRKEAKDYGTKKMLEGNFQQGQNCLIIEDVVTSGMSVLETAELLRNNGLQVTDAVVLLNREQGAEEKLLENGIRLHSVCKVTDLMKVLEKHNRVTSAMTKSVLEFIRTNQVHLKKDEKSAKSLRLTLDQRLKSTTSELAKKLINVMLRKGSNLCVAADVKSVKELLDLAQSLGPYICCLKTHVDVLRDWNAQAVQDIKEAAARFDFILFEDRKFADIGNTVMKQYELCALEWADLVTVHGVAGTGTLDALRKASESVGEPRGALVVAQMSCEGNLISPEYTKRCVAMVEQEGSFAIGLVSQSRLSNQPDVLHFTPGVHMSKSEDSLSQRYVSPEEAVLTRGADVIIVGRGITEAASPEEAAKEYQKIGWKSYLQSIGS